MKIPVPNWPGYTACSDGSILGKTGRPLKASPHGRTGHLRVRLYGENGHRKGTRSGWFTDFYVHVLISLAFHGEPPFEDALVRHLDNDSQNNVPGNLAWGTRLENAADYWSDEEAVHCREERKGLRGAYSPYVQDMYLGF